MRTPILALALGFAVAAGFAGTAAVRPALADDPAPLTDADQARVRQLIDNLGSDDFLIREGASKALLTEFGARAKPALTVALKHESAEVRFRADQLLRRIDGQNRERPVGQDDGGGAPPAGGQPPAPGVLPPPGWHEWLRGGDAQKWAEEMEKRFREIERRMQEEMGRAFGPERFRLPLFGNAGNLLRQRHFAAEGAELTLNLRGGAKLTLTEGGPDGQKVTTTYEGKSLDDILASHPDLKGRPGVASIVEQVAKAKEAEKKAAEDAAKRRGGLGFGGGFSFQSRAQGVQIESTPGHVKVTVTETGPDGKETTKTYEGTDLESLKKEHPELADKVGGIQLHIGPLPDGWSPFGKDRVKPVKPVDPWGEDEDGDGGMEAPPSDETGPFGLQIGPVEEILRTHLGLDKGAGALVRVVRPQSQADELGLKPLDVITAVNGKPVTGLDSAGEALRSVEKGTPLSIDVIRSGKPLKLSR